MEDPKHVTCFKNKKDNAEQVETKQNDASLSAPQQGLQALQKLQVRSSQEIYWSYLEIVFPNPPCVVYLPLFTKIWVPT